MVGSTIVPARSSRRHGGSVEHMADGELSAVFGVPVVREDDALRAVRAALELRDELAGLGLEARVGVNTGEVLVGGPAAGRGTVSGDPVSVGRGLEQAATPGEVLIGEATLTLVREGAEVEPLEPLALRGRAEPVHAYRLLASAGAAPERAHGMRVSWAVRPSFSVMREAGKRGGRRAAPVSS